eukprot:bmy_11033T0
MVLLEKFQVFMYCAITMTSLAVLGRSLPATDVAMEVGVKSSPSNAGRMMLSDALEVQRDKRHAQGFGKKICKRTMKIALAVGPLPHP